MEEESIYLSNINGINKQYSFLSLQKELIFWKLYAMQNSIQIAMCICPLFQTT